MGVSSVLSKFAKLVTGPDRSGLADFLEMLVCDLREEPPIDPVEKPWFMPEHLRNVAAYRLHSQAVQEGRAAE